MRCGQLVKDACWVCSGRRHRLRTLPGRLGYGLLRGGEEGMTPAELRALPIVIYERRHHHQRDSAFDTLLVRAPVAQFCRCLPSAVSCTETY